MNDGKQSLIDTLIDNAKYIPNAQAFEEPSPCELKCKAQQTALVACMETIRQTNDSNSDQTKVDSHCLVSSVSAWTECCSKANNGNGA